MKKFSLLISLSLLLFFAIQVNAQNGTTVNANGVVLTTNLADVQYFMPLGQADGYSKIIFLGGKKRLTDEAELDLKKKAIEQGANVVLVTFNQFGVVSTNGRATGNQVHMTGILYMGKTASSSNNASSANVIQTSDLSGKWEGFQTNGQLIMHYEVNLSKIGENVYSGYDYCRWLRNANNSPMQYQGNEPPNAKKAFLASFNNDRLSANEIGDIENSNWGLANESFKLVNNNGTLVLIAGDGNNGTRRFSLMRTGDYPQDYLKYVVSRGALKIDTVNYYNPNQAASITYNEKGYLEFSINNTTAIDFKGLKIKLEFDNNGAGITSNDAGNISFDANANGQVTFRVAITTNLGLPATSTAIHLNIFANGNPVAGKYFSLPTISFFKSPTVASPSYTSARMQAVAGYYGFGGMPYSDASKQLEPLVASGDKMAAMWKAVFLSLGRGGYKIDEDQGYALGKTCLRAVEDKARNGDAEATYLMFYAFEMGLENPDDANTFAPLFLQKAAEAGFKPAVLDYALELKNKKDYAGAYSYLLAGYKAGVKKAAEALGRLHEGGLGTDKDDDSAVAWYKKGMDFGDPDAIFCYATLVAKGMGNAPPDINKAIALATNAAGKNCIDAIQFLGNTYLDGKQGIARNAAATIKWFKIGADLGDRQAMLRLGETYIADIPGIVKDEHTGLYWIKKAAEGGSPAAMFLLAGLYSEGKAAEKDIILGRYWRQQAALAGYGQADATGANANAQNFLNFFKYADFSPSYEEVETYYGDRYIRESDDGLLGGVISGMIGSITEYYGNLQEPINGLEFIRKKNGVKIYGGTLNLAFISNLNLKKGETVNIKVYGIVSMGMFAGSGTADGLPGWDEYKYVQSIPCAAVMATVKGVDDWKFIGQSRSYTAPQDGVLTFALNGRDRANYKGYFDIVLEEPEIQNP